MASIKISELNEKTNLIDGDLVPVVDTIGNETKKITYGNLKTQIIDDRFAVINYDTATNGFHLMYSTPLPTGYNGDNCTVISWMWKYTSGEDTDWHYIPDIYGQSDDDSEYIDKTYYLRITNSSIVFVDLKQYTKHRAPEEPIGDDRDIIYRIVLMKVA